jgi:hypothetical protein
MHHLQPGRMQEHFHRQMHGSEIAGGAVGNLARVVAHRGDELVERLPGRRLLHRQQRRIGEHARERHELVDLVGGGLALQLVGLRDHRERRQRDHQRVAVGLGARHIGMADSAARTALVLDHHVAPELLGEMCGKRAAGEIGGPARRKRHDDRDGARRPGLLRAQVARQNSRHERKPG